MPRSEKRIWLRRVPALLLAALMLALWSPRSSSAATSIICTVLNDQILSLEDATMPQRRGSTFYVPYTHFTDYMGLRAIYSPSSQSLTLYKDTSLLYFNLARGTVSDESDVSYFLPAFYSSGTPYVPVSLVCNKFALFYSYISHTTPILRISSSRSSLSDSAFVQMTQSIIANMVYDYQQQHAASQPPTTDPSVDPPLTTNEPPAPQDTPYPSRVALTYDGALSEQSMDVLEQLADAQLSATFFLPPDSLTKYPDVVRAILGGGHSLGLLVSSRQPLEQAQQGNEILAQHFYTHTLLLRCVDGSLTAEQTQALAAQGYRLWRWQIDSGDAASRSASAAARSVMAALENTTAPQVIRLGLGEQSAALTRRLASQMRAHSVAAYPLYDSMTPLS